MRCPQTAKSMHLRVLSNVSNWNYNPIKTLEIQLKKNISK